MGGSNDQPGVPSARPVARGRGSSEGEAFLTDVARALHRLGLPADRLEGILEAAARQLGVAMMVFAEPTALLVVFGPEDAQRVIHLRVSPAEVDLGRLAALDRLLRRVVRGERDPATARAHMRAILEQDAWPAWVVFVAHMAAAGSTALLFGGSQGDAAASALVGAGVAAIERTAASVPAVRRIEMPLAAFCATAGARLAVGHIPDVHPGISALAGVIVYLPGLTFTLAMTELASGHLASGVARAASAVVSLLLITVGVALAERVVPVGTGSTAAQAMWSLDATLPAVLVGAAAFGVLLRARPRDLLPVILSGVTSFYAASFASERLGEVLGAGAGAMVVGLLSVVYGRLFDRTSLVPLVPGVLMLVPGSIGYRSFSAMLGGKVLAGVDQAFRMGMIGVTIAAGLLMAEALRDRRVS